MPNTKIVATLGPASDSPAVLHGLLEAGADVFRLNASHGTQEKHAERIGAARAAAEEFGKHVGILLLPLLLRSPNSMPTLIIDA